MENLVEAFLKLANSTLGKKGTRIFSWIVLVVLTGMLILVGTQFAIEKIDWLVERFSITQVSWGSFISIVGFSIAATIIWIGLGVMIALFISLIMRIVVDASQRGKTEMLLNKVDALVNNLKVGLSPEQVKELDLVTNEIRDIKRMTSIFRVIQNWWHRPRKGGKNDRR